jgi:hypothetical protein
MYAQAYFSMEPMFFTVGKPQGNAAVESTHIPVHNIKQRQQ